MARVLLVKLALLILLLLGQASSSSGGDAPTQETFSEEVIVSPLPSGHIQVLLHFSLKAPRRRHYAILPKAVGQLAAAVPFEEVELSLTQGRWHHDTWGTPLLPAKPGGAELRASFSSEVPEPQLPLLWGNLSHSLSGLFCASLNFLARPETTARQAIEFEGEAAEQPPTHSLDGGGGGGGGGGGPRIARLRRLYAALPKEVVCTENLTPALKLLPCRDQAGVASLLLHRPTIYGADYHSLRVHIAAERGAPSDGGGLGGLASTRLSLSVALVLRPPPSAGSGRATRWSAPKPRTYSSWSLGELLGSNLRGVCPVAASSRLMVQLPPQLAVKANPDLLMPPPWAGSAGLGRGDASGSPPRREMEIEAEPGDDGDMADDQQQEEVEAGGAPAAAGAAAGAAGEAAGRAAAWDTSAFRLSPAPDGVALGRGGAASGGGGGGAPADVFYMYDLMSLEHEQQLLRERLGEDAAGAFEPDQFGPAVIEASQEWLPAAAGGAAAAQRPELSVARYTTGAGFMNGGMVLEIAAEVAGGGAAAAAAADEEPGGDASGAAAGGYAGSYDGANRTVCIFQTIPWYVRVWTHTMRLTVGGAPADFARHLTLRRVSPASDRRRPLVLDLCLELPASAPGAALEVRFSKAFLHVFEWPPDAHRGFDVPAALISYVPLAGRAPGGAGGLAPAPVAWEWRAARSDLGKSSSEGGGDSGGGGGAGSSCSAAESEALSEVSRGRRVQQLYGESLLVPLAPPDFSMPYNVVCLTSTVLAIYLGAALNALLRRPGEELRAAAKGGDARAAKLKAAKVVVVVVVFGGLALYVDEELRQQVVKWLAAAGLAELPAASPGAH